MTRAVRGLDHVVVMVDGIDAAEAAYRKLGFQVQPRGFHKKLGTANHLMIFDKDYFEILRRRAWSPMRRCSSIVPSRLRARRSTRSSVPCASPRPTCRWSASSSANT